MPDLVGSFLNLSAMHQQTAAAERMADKQNKENERMWRMNNAYNAPAAQMQRYKDAGLNPALVYGQMPQANAPDMVGGSPAAPASATPGDSITELAQLDLLDAQKDNIEADTAAKLADAGLKGREKTNIDFTEWLSKEQLRLQEAATQSGIELNDAHISNLEEQNKKLAAEVDKIGVDAAIARLEESYIRKSFDDRLKLVKSEVRKNYADAHLSDAQASRIAKLVDQELSNMKAEFAEINARKDLTQQQKSNLAQQKLVEYADNCYLIAAQEAAKNGQTLKKVGNEMVHLFTHILRFTLK